MNRSITIDDCCMKQTVRKRMFKLIGAVITPKECKALCAYYYISWFCAGYIVLRLNLVIISLLWLLYPRLETEPIITIASIINSMLIIGLYEELIGMVGALFCKCESN